MNQATSCLSQTSSYTNFEYFQIMESNIKKDNVSQISDRQRRYILAKDIKNYENEQKVKQNQDNIESSLQSNLQHGQFFNNNNNNNNNERTYLSVDKPISQQSNANHLSLKGLHPQNKLNQNNLTTINKYLSPKDIPNNNNKKLNDIKTNNNSSAAAIINSSSIKSNNNIKGDYNNTDLQNVDYNNNFQQSQSQLKQAQSTTIFPNNKKPFLGNTIFQETSIKEKNIFLEKNNPINHSLYKEFNVGPRMDKEVGNPQWFTKQKDLNDKTFKQNRRSSQAQKNSISQTDENDRIKKNKSIYTAKSITDNPLQNSSFQKQISLVTDKSFILRPDTSQSIMKQSSYIKKKPSKKNEQIIEVSKDELMREVKDIERRHQLSMQHEDNTLKKLPLDVQHLYTRDDRVLKSYEQHQMDWDKQIQFVSKMSSRNATDSCMLRGEQHRRKVEYAQAFDNLKTEDERFGKRIWYMYLRKYPKEKKKEEEDENRQNRQRYITETTGTQQNNNNTNNKLNKRYEDEIIQNQQKQSNVVFNVGQNDKNNLTTSRRNKSKIKLKELIDPNENTQSDIFSGFMTVTIHDQNKEIEVIRNSQDPNHFHLSSSSAFSAFKKTSSQFFIESKVRECQAKLKGKMVILEQPINDFLVVGKNKLESEKNALLNDHNRVFNKVINIDSLDDGQGKKSKNSITQQNSNNINNNNNNNNNNFSQNLNSRTQNTEIISQDYDINELSRTGQYFFPNLTEKLNHVSISSSQFK